jgi:hypothetical protein
MGGKTSHQHQIIGKDYERRITGQLKRGGLDRRTIIKTVDKGRCIARLAIDVCINNLTYCNTASCLAMLNRGTQGAPPNTHPPYRTKG